MSKKPTGAPTSSPQGTRGPSLSSFKPPQFRISERRTLLVYGDIAATLLSVLIALALWAAKAQEAFTIPFILDHLIWFFVLPLLWFILANANDYYHLGVTARLASSFMRLLWITLQLLVVYLATFFLSTPGSLPRRFIVYYAVVSFLLIGLLRAARLSLMNWSGLRRRALIVGPGWAAEMITRAIKEEAMGDYEIVGSVSSKHDLAVMVGQGATVGAGVELPKIVRHYGVAELIVAYVNEMPDDIFEGLIECYGQGVEITPMPTLYEQITRRTPIELMAEHLWTFVLPLEKRPLAFNLYLALKRALDILLSLVGLALFALLLPFFAVLIKLDSPGPVFYYQKRVGQGSKPFTLVKLRSMIPRAEQDSGPRWAEPYDPRVTRIGSILRKSRLDEVPQLLNVLRGQMSLVGPRPERPEFVNFLASEIPFYKTRLAVKPGLTGWAQVRYRYGSTKEDALRKLQYDLYYIRHQSLMLDAMILIKTIGIMVRFQGT
jgi:exopolysaccharide biosynthesis polyprenyl glycosylphosphotransferase